MPSLYMLGRSVHVLGAGGIGVVLAWSLLRRGCDVTVIEADSDKVNAGRKDGLTVVGHGTEYPPFEAFEEWDPPENAFILLCTKTYDNPSILRRLKSAAHLFPVQNGFDQELDKLKHPGEGIASFVSECLRDRPVTRITRPGDLHIGARRDVTGAERAEIASLAAALSYAGPFSVKLVQDVRPYKAAKLMYNAAISPLGATAGIDNGELLIDPLARQLFFRMLQENYDILTHARVSLARIGPFHPDTVSKILRTPVLPSLMAVFFRPSLRGTYCSMAQDISTGRTQIDAYNGHLVRLAGNLPCPLNRAAVALVETFADKRLTPTRDRLQDLASMLPAGVLS